MTEDEAEEKYRGIRKKGPPRLDFGLNIVEQWARTYLAERAKRQAE